MKANEYVSKYGDTIYKELRHGKTDELQKVFHEFLVEMSELAKSRTIGSMTGLLHVIDETNEKWNAFARQFDKKYGTEGVIRRNAVLKVNEEALSKLP